MHAIGQSPSCLCAVMLSGTARAAGIKPEVAITIPKRCNMTDRPVGYKCGGTCMYMHIYFKEYIHICAVRSHLNLFDFHRLHAALTTSSARPCARDYDKS